MATWNVTFTDFTTVPTTLPPLPKQPFVWTNTLIVVVAVAAYAVFCIILCLLYRCLRSRGSKKSSPCNNFTCAPLTTCLECGCLNACSESLEARCTWCTRSSSACDSLLDRCCPKRNILDCEDIILCKGAKINVTCPKFCMNAEKSGVWDRFLARRKQLCGPRKPPICCRYESDAACCGYGGNGNCRFFCLECTTRDRKRPATEAPSPAPIAFTPGLGGYYPPYPPPSGQPFTIQPGYVPPPGFLGPAMYPWGPTPTSPHSDTATPIPPPRDPGLVQLPPGPGVVVDLSVHQNRLHEMSEGIARKVEEMEKEMVESSSVMESTEMPSTSAAAPARPPRMVDLPQDTNSLRY
ncbi:uncharacterized protein LOC129593731 [Paramacrobiotus metropolitanus]|uniref:uncharacterized protein LOC129593731 n=1 Tax=Paramacrobiotus metropolitanus TaxID=2943436 RepID=UPI002445D82A|nr:uncharacterized protein LOC129593731 [Paramacrobiotus metropolitanus]